MPLAIALVWPFGGWMAFQVFVILLQSLYGPAFFLPARVSLHILFLCVMY